MLSRSNLIVRNRNSHSLWSLSRIALNTIPIYPHPHSRVYFHSKHHPSTTHISRVPINRSCSMAAAVSPDVDAVLTFWFGDYQSATIPFKKSWFMSTPEFDSEIVQKFGVIMEEALAGGLREWEGSCHGLVAKILVLDQFTRNVYRGTAKAFAGDPEAQRLALAFCENPGFDALPDTVKWFGLMPFMHSENMEMQKRGLREFPRASGMFASAEKEVMKHYALIERFGRYPHRNATLGRVSTAEEVEFLAASPESFGQTGAKKLS